MQFNTCEVCGATDGRAGMLIREPQGPAECLNCRDSRLAHAVVLHSNLPRTPEEIKRMHESLNKGESNNDRS